MNPGASMGPRSSDRGNTGQGRHAETATGLQWGRDHLIAEMEKPQAKKTPQGELQWGRDHLIAEISKASH